MFAAQDPTGARQLTLQTLFLLHLLMPLVLLLQFRKVFNETVLKKKLSCGNLNGASVMMRKKSGVGKQLQDIAQHPVCITHFYSPKRRREVNEIAAILDQEHVYYSGLQKTRWVASRLRAINA